MFAPNRGMNNADSSNGRIKIRNNRDFRSPKVADFLLEGLEEVVVEGPGAGGSNGKPQEEEEVALRGNVAFVALKDIIVRIVRIIKNFQILSHV